MKRVGVKRMIFFESVGRVVFLCEKLTAIRYNLAIKIYQDVLFSLDFKKSTQANEVYFDPENEIIMFGVFDHSRYETKSATIILKWERDIKNWVENPNLPFERKVEHQIL
jgi:hypothetical protein